jgi:hypothetical protein
LIGARYNNKKPHFEISVKFLIFWTPYRPISRKKIFGPIKWFFELKISFPQRKTWNKEKHLFYFIFRSSWWELIGSFRPGWKSISKNILSFHNRQQINQIFLLRWKLILSLPSMIFLLNGGNRSDLSARGGNRSVTYKTFYIFAKNKKSIRSFCFSRTLNLLSNGQKIFISSLICNEPSARNQLTLITVS